MANTKQEQDEVMREFEQAGKSLFYRPNAPTARVLDTAWDFVAKLPYTPSLRFIFYQIYQESLFDCVSPLTHKEIAGGINRKAKAYEWFTDKTSKARKGNYGEWKPDTFEDDTRNEIDRNGRFETVGEWQGWVDSLEPDLDNWYSQDNYVEVWFEARAMKKQFMHFVPKFATLEPFGGDTSIYRKYQIAQRIENAFMRYGKPVKILYFGDCDKKGNQIPKSAENDIRQWCGASFRLDMVGLTLGQATALKLPVNFEKPGEYQWEALTHRQAGKIIRSAVMPLLK